MLMIYADINSGKNKSKNWKVKNIKGAHALLLLLHQLNNLANGSALRVIDGTLPDVL